MAHFHCSAFRDGRDILLVGVLNCIDVVARFGFGRGRYD
jgi:hypothetical protein